MPKHNINLLQNAEDLKYLSEHNVDYYVQALANLGQRTGVKGDSISYKYFTFADVLGVDVDSIDTDDYIGLIKYNDNVANIGLITKGNKYDGVDTITQGTKLEPEKNIFGLQYIPYDLSFDVTVNNIQKYKKDSILKVNDDYFVSALYGKLLGTSDDEENNVEIQYTKININTGIIDSAIRAFHLYNTFYIMLVLKNVDSTKYSLSCYIVDADSIETEASQTDILQQSFKDSFTWSKLEDNNFYFNSNGVDVATATLDELLSYNGDNSNSNDTSIFGLFNQFTMYQTEVETNFTITLVLDTDKDNTLTIADTTLLENGYANITELLTKDIYGLTDRVTAINNDINFTYPNLLSEYTENQFRSTRQTLAKRILLCLYEKIYSSYSEESDSTPNVMYVPLDYQFNYMCNSSDSLEVYYANDLYVTLTDLDQFTKNDRITFFKENTNIIYDYDGEDKIKIFNVVVNYNKEYDEYVNSITINNQYTLPYINAENNWQINDVNTKISALGKNAGNPNIILVWSTPDSYKILSSSNIDYINALDWEQKQFKVNPDSVASVSTTKDEDIICTAYVPDISADDMSYFTDALLVNMSSSDCLSTDNEEGSITSLWTAYNMVNDNGSKTPEFAYICAPDESYAFDMNNLFNMSSVVQSTVVNNKLLNSNKFNIIGIETTPNQIIQDNAETDTNYFIAEATNISKTETSDYKNSAELEVRFNKNIELSDNGLIIEDANNLDINNNCVKYLSNINEIESDANVAQLYDKYVKTVEPSENKQLVAEQITEFNSNTYIIGNTDGDINFQDLRGITTAYVASYITTTTSEIYKTTEKYPEYVLNSDVPTIDFKEVLLRNENVINRTNIISIGNTGYLYHSYIGSTWDNKCNKNELHIGTSSYDINIGLDTMISYEEVGKFKEQDKLYIDIANTYFNSLTVTSNTPFVECNTINEVSYYISSTRAIGYIFSKIQADPLWPTNTPTFVSTELQLTNVSRTALRSVIGNDTDNMFIYVNASTSSTFILLNLNKFLYDKYKIDITQLSIENNQLSIILNGSNVLEDNSWNNLLIAHNYDSTEYYYYILIKWIGEGNITDTTLITNIIDVVFYTVKTNISENILQVLTIKLDYIYDDNYSINTIFKNESSSDMSDNNNIVTPSENAQTAVFENLANYVSTEQYIADVSEAVKSAQNNFEQNN